MENSVEKLIEKINFEKEKAIENGIIRKEKPQKEISDREKYCKLPDTWIWIRLGDYCLKATDYVASGSFASIKENVNYYNTENYAIMVKTADFANNFTKNLTYTDESSYKFLSNSNLFGGELILSNIGSIGKVFKVPYLNKPMTLASNTIMIKFTDDKLADYMYYYFKSNYGQNAIKSISSGTSMLKFNKTQLKTLPIPIPSIEIQEKIVTALDKAQSLIDKKREQIELLDELVKSRFIEMFGDPVSNLKDWKKQKINEVAPVSNYKGEFNEEKIWLLNLDMVESNSGRIIDFNYVDKEEIGSSTCTFDTSNVLYSKLRPYLNKVVIPERIGYATSEMIPLKPNKKVLNREYLTYSLRNKSFVDYISEKVSGAKMPRVVMNDFKNFELPIPPIELQNEFAEFVTQIDSIRSKMESSLSELEDNFNSLMQKAFKAELF
ncbi:restriction endonuclease subunit S [Peptoclostridium sp. AF21-18]|uniref:restriction endonuclease subunit S n=1 Tax=Peptoclostridium sp. AF21-18 TaxID=2292243 RepID=UPI000E47301D|nr:restriction endonuclease subunit S [Peptoclostridium sp. AF21-18]RHQ97410.1 restriction endonuclease subunit S [Peptoclostridium sp. AF21-18]